MPKYKVEFEIDIINPNLDDVRSWAYDIMYNELASKNRQYHIKENKLLTTKVQRKDEPITTDNT